MKINVTLVPLHLQTLVISFLLVAACCSQSTEQEAVPDPPPSGGGSGKLAFCYQPVSGASLTKEIYTIQVDGSGQTGIAALSVSLNAPDWSPDGSQIAAYGYPNDATWSIYLMDSDGSNLRRLTSTQGVWDHVPDWSPDGAQIVFSRVYPNQNHRPEIWLMDTDGGNQHWIGVEGDYASWSPDGQMFTYSTQRNLIWDIYTCNSDGTGEIRLTSSDVNEINPSWSPDGSRIAYSTDADGDFEIWVMDSDGSNPVRLTSNTAGDFSPAWSPDGSLIAWDTNLPDIANNHWEVYVMRSDGSQIWRVTQMPPTATAIHPDWEPGLLLKTEAHED